MQVERLERSFVVGIALICLGMEHIRRAMAAFGSTFSLQSRVR